jgi:uncharacterized protein with LGFP repeats
MTRDGSGRLRRTDQTDSPPEDLLVRRILTGLTAFAGMTTTFLVLPVYAAPMPQVQPVTTSSSQLDLGSVADPAPAADVQQGTTDPVAGVAESAPTLTVTRTDVAPFSLVGVTWALDPAVTDTVVSVRVQDGGGTWGSWTEVTPETADQAGGARPDTVLRGGTSPLWTGPSTGVDVELVTRSGARPTDVQLDLVDPGSSPADGQLSGPGVTGTAHAAMAMPAVFSRAQWGADERLRSWEPKYASTIKAATVHHTADSNDYTADQVPAIMRSIYRYHAVSLGWGDIGYNVIVDKFGRLWEGRSGGLASTVIGAHAGGFNTGTFGVSMLGNYDLVPVPQVTVAAVSAVIAWKFSLYGVDPVGTTVLTSSGGGTSRYKAGSRVTLPTVFAHRDVGATACPGRYGFARMPEIRDQVAERMAGAVSPIDSRYLSDASLQATLGAPSGDQQSVGEVQWQQYAGGRMYWSPSTGAHALWGAILDRYLALGGPAALGAPVTDHSPAPREDGYYAWFQGGSIYWSPATGAQLVTGWIADRWAALGREQGALGYPTGEEVPATGGVGQSFSNGVVYSSAGTGAHAVVGAAAVKWKALGGVSSFLGYPTVDTKSVTGGSVTGFRGGSVYAAGTGKAWEVHGWIRDLYVARGAQAGVLGFPTSDEQRSPDGVGVFQTFAKGVVYSTPRTGARALHGPVFTKWSSLGGMRSFLGGPVSNELTMPDGKGTAWVFASGGAIYRHPATGAFEVHGWIRDLYSSLNGEQSFLGYPTSDETPVLGGAAVQQTFQGGVVYSSPRTGAREVHGAILDRYRALGGPGSKLGLPTRNEYSVSGGRRSDFQHGTITCNTRTGALTVTIR